MRKKILAVLSSMAIVACLFAVPISAEETMTQAEFEEKLATSTGEIDLQDATVELETALTISQDVTIKNGMFVGKNQASNLVTVTGHVTFEDVTIETSSENWSALHVYGGEVIANGLYVRHMDAAKGAPILLNNGAKGIFNDVALAIGTHSWYGMNVDNSSATFNSKPIIEYGGETLTSTQSVVCAENDGIVEGLTYTQVITEVDGGGKNKQVAYVDDNNLEKFIAAKTSANAKITDVILNRDVTLLNPLTISEGMTINGRGYTLTINNDGDPNNAINVTSKDLVTIDDLTIKTGENIKSGLHVYGANVSASNLTIDNSATEGGAPIILNGGTLQLNQTTNLILGDKSWGGINVDDRGAPGETPTLQIGAVNLIVPEGMKKIVLYYADNNENGEPVVSLENVSVGSSVFVNGQEVSDKNIKDGIITVPDAIVVEPQQPETSKPNNTTPTATDVKKTSHVKTGDNTNILLFELTAMLAIVGLATIFVSKKRNDLLNK